jgi:hypothetical protein
VKRERPALSKRLGRRMGVRAVTERQKNLTQRRKGAKVKRRTDFIKRLDSDLSVLCVSVVNFPLCVRGGLRAFGPGDRVKPRDPRETLKVSVSCVDGTVVGKRKCSELSISDKVSAPPGVL